MTPPQKIAWGILLTLLLVTSPIGLWLLITGLWQLHVPTWRVRTYVRQAALEPANAPELLSQAAAIDPLSPEVLAPLAELKSGQGDDVAALALYRLYCERVPSDWLARGHLALAALKSNQIDEAIAELTTIRAGAVATDDSKASIDAHLSYAYLCKEDPQQALALCEPSASRANADGPGAQQCLFYRGVSQYMLGRTGGAINDLDHLYALNPGYQGLQAVKDAMTTRTYELLLPDGAALVPVAPGQVTLSAVKVERTAPRSPHCLTCQAPLRVGALECPYCHAAVASTAPHSDAPPPPPPPPP
jgi:tetratricopeptide (TPR) repeat protein